MGTVSGTSIFLLSFFVFLLSSHHSFSLSEYGDKFKNPFSYEIFSQSLSVFLIPPLTENEAPHTELQYRTISSLLRLNPPPQIFLLGNHSSFFSLKSQFPDNVHQDFQLDFVFEPGFSDSRGSPLFHSTIARALSAKTLFSMVINADVAIINQTSLEELVDEASEKFSENGFLLTWPRYNIDQMPPVLSERPSSDKDFIISDRDLSRHVSMFGRLETAGGAGAWLWDNRKILYYGKMPPFPAGRSELDTWLAHATLLTTKREVIDGGNTVTCGSTRHLKLWDGEKGVEGERWVKNKKKFFALVRAHGQRREAKETFEGLREGENLEVFVEKGCPTRNPWISKRCENDGGRICLTQVNCTCNSKISSLGFQSSFSYTSKTHNIKDLKRQKWLCNAISPKPYLTTQGLTMASSPLEGLTLEELLPIMADSRKIVTLVAVSSGYSDMLMNFVCTLRRLGLRDPLIAALDEDLYHFASVQGLPVFLEQFEVEKRENNEEMGKEREREAKCSFGSSCFRSVTKLKSRTVLRILKLGYHVFWSDVDIAWFRDPITEIYDMGPGTFPVQSDKKGEDTPVNRGKINSGFYLARSEPLVIQAFEAIIKRAMEHEHQTEQPSFYWVLCGEKMDFLSGDDECLWNGLRVIFLDRNVHPNGFFHGFWQKPIEACIQMGCATLHNNWIAGKENKIKRFKRKNLWWWDEETRLCRYNWYGHMVGITKGE